MGTKEQLDLDILPEEAKKEIKDFYEFLVSKYATKKARNKKAFLETVKMYSFKLPVDYKFNREELHER
jgi:hypothetical protein